LFLIRRSQFTVHFMAARHESGGDEVLVAAKEADPNITDDEPFVLRLMLVAGGVRTRWHDLAVRGVGMTTKLQLPARMLDDARQRNPHASDDEVKRSSAQSIWDQQQLDGRVREWTLRELVRQELSA